MSNLRIHLHPDPVLRQVCAPVTGFGDDLSTLARDMLQVMYDAPGRGLAAPQVGIAQRLFVIDPTWKDGGPTPLICVNPVLAWTSDETALAEEGCLSIPDTPCMLRRPVAIRLSWQDTDGTPQEGTLDGIAARCALHELDHLDGILCIDRAEGDAA